MSDLRSAICHWLFAVGRSSGWWALVLTQVENGREYGIKVAADITTKTADVLVDDELKAQWCADLP